MKISLIITLTLALLILQSCKESTTEFAKKWTKEIKLKILEDANMPIDSTFFDSARTTVTTYNKGIRLKTFFFMSYPTDTAGSYTFSTDQNFKIVQELCPVISRSFEAIDYKGNQVGLVEFRRCNGALLEQGFRFDGDIGTWIEYDSTGHEVKKRVAGDINNLEKLRDIKYYR